MNNKQETKSVKNIPVFVYGTLLSKGSNPINQMVDAEFVGSGRLFSAAIYDLGWYPGLWFTAQPEDAVIGEVHFVDRESLLRLDSYEGEGSLYLRRPAVAHLDEGYSLPVFVYEYASPHEGELIPTGDWIEYRTEKERKAA